VSDREPPSGPAAAPGGPILVPGGTVLVLGGTGEGRELADRLAGAGVRVISSLAGRVSTPRRPAGQVRTGGFGGADGLAEYLARQEISAVVDATHPFAAQITANAVTACARTGTPLLGLRRPPWVPRELDRWTAVPDLDSAATGVAAFAASGQRFWLRAVEPPDGPGPARLDLILDRGPFRVEAEIALMQRLSIDVVVTKNSGGPMTAAKLTAARELGLPVVVVDRPALPPGGRTVSTVAAALTWLGVVPV
jgi:precorrin-6A/cobalt-precorrin-6A reductase